MGDNEKVPYAYGKIIKFKKSPTIPEKRMVKLGVGQRRTELFSIDACAIYVIRGTGGTTRNFFIDSTFSEQGGSLCCAQAAELYGSLRTTQD